MLQPRQRERLDVRPLPLEGGRRRLLGAAIHWGAHGQICWHLDLLSGRKYSRSQGRVHELLDRLEALGALDLEGLCVLDD